jgi:hypothetical protein
MRGNDYKFVNYYSIINFDNVAPIPFLTTSNVSDFCAQIIYNLATPRSGSNQAIATKILSLILVSG